MSNLITPRFQLVELQVPTSQTSAGQLTFQQVPQLQSFYNTDYFVYILAIDCYTSDSLAFSPFNNNNPIATAADIRNATLTLVRLGDEAHKEIPLAQLCRIFGELSSTPAVFEPFQFPDEWQIDWTKSYIHLVQAPVSTPPFSYMLGVHYSYYPTPTALQKGVLPQAYNLGSQQAATTAPA